MGMGQRVAIIGTGLIGGSIGLAIKQSKMPLEIVGHDKSPEAAGLARKRGAIDRAEWNLLAAIQGAGLIIIATPVAAVREVLVTIGPHVRPGAIITDTASTKEQVMAWADQFLPRNVNFIGGHPMAGKEESGVEAADPALFKDAAWCLLPGNTTEAALETVINLVTRIGAKPYFISPAEHDSFVAAVSHLPFLLATTLVATTMSSPQWREMRRLASSGYRDASRLASGDAEMYRDICLTNKESILRWMDIYISGLRHMRELVASESPDLLKAFAEAHAARDLWLRTQGDANPDAAPLPEISMGDQLRQMLFGGLWNPPRTPPTGGES
jgi:prephenate dehydrogenase